MVLDAQRELEEENEMGRRGNLCIAREQRKDQRVLYKEEKGSCMRTSRALS